MFGDDVEKLEIAPGEVETLLGDLPADMELVDVREGWELTRGILPGAVHIPLSRFQEYFDHWQPGKRYIIYCEHGVRSLDVAIWLAHNKSIAALSMKGGFSVWKGETTEPAVDGE